MFKFLRRYSKWILAVGGTLLLITFLIPFAFQGLGQMAATSGATWATVGEDESSVSVREYQELLREKRIVEMLPPGLIAPVDIKDVEHWYLLAREAEQAGLVGGPDDAMAFLGPNASTALSNISAQFGERAEFVLRTIARYRGVVRLVSMYRSAAHFSDHRLRAAAQRLFHTTTARFFVLEAAANPNMPEPSQDEIDAQFAKYADVLPGEGEHGFGYLLPDRVKLEWVQVPADAVRAAVEASPEFNEVALRKHWLKNPNMTFPPITEGAAVPEVVKSDLASKLFEQRMQEIEREGVEYLRAATRGLSRTGSYYVLPDDWAQRRPSLPALATKLQEEFGIELPEYHSTGDRWVSAQDAADLEGIGAATTNRFGTAALALPALIRQLKEFGNAVEAVVQEGVAGPPLRGADGSLYFFRITAADRARRAKDSSEVRDMVVRDLKRLADYERLTAASADLESEARTDGILALLVSHPAGEFFEAQDVSLANVQLLMFQAQLGRALTAIPTRLPVVGPDEEAVGAIIKHAMALPPLVAVKDLTPEQRIFTVPVDTKLAVLVVEIMNNTPVTRETFNRGTDMGLIQLLLLNQELDNGEDIADAFSVETLAQRHHFKLTNPPSEEEQALKTANAAR